MLFQPTNIIPDTRTGIGFGVVDATQGMQVSWQVNGDYPVMTAFQIIIYLNNAASTVKLNTGKLTAGCPFYGRDASGEIQFFAYTIAPGTLSSAGITNGNEYKFTIRQYYMQNGAETSILQSSASVFVTRAQPSFALNEPLVNAAESTFSWSYSQAQGDTLDWIRYQLQVVSGSSTAMLYDSGSIYGPSSYQFTFSGFIIGTTYAVRAFGQTSSGVSMNTAWYQFEPNYVDQSASGSVVAACTVGYDAVHVTWDNASTFTGQDIWILYRKQSGNLAMQKVGEFPIAQRGVYDFWAASGQGPYTYVLFAGKAANPSSTPPTQTQYISAALSSNDVTPTRYYWALLDCEEMEDGNYRVKKEFDFKNNLNSGSISNNNNPNVLKNFTAMPTVQLSPTNYKSGSLSALMGKTANGQYLQDTLALRDELMALGTSQDTLFLKSSKGDTMMVAINGAVSVDILDTAPGQPQLVTVPWIEVDDTPVSVIAYPGDPVFNS